MLPKLCCIHSSLHATNHPLQRGNTHSFFSLDYITPPCDVSEHMVWAPQLFLCFFPIKEACRAPPSWTSVHHHWPCCSSLCLAILMEVLLCPCHASWHLGPQPPFCFGSSRHIHTHTHLYLVHRMFLFLMKRLLNLHAVYLIMHKWVSVASFYSVKNSVILVSH